MWSHHDGDFGGRGGGYGRKTITGGVEKAVVAVST